MKTSLLLLIAALTAGADPKPPTDAELLAFIAQRAKLERVTAAGTKADAVPMDPKAAELCRALRPRDNPHPKAFFHVYANEAAAGPVWDPHGKFPVGALLLKEKLDAAAGGRSRLFTGMLKREAGFNPACGDWEFFAADGAGQRLDARGKLESCMACHRQYAARDFATKVYACPPGPAAPVPGYDSKQPARALAAVPQTSLGTIHLHSCRATVHGEKLSYEPPAHKDTLGYWTNVADWAEWRAEVRVPGEFSVEVLQGCGKGSGGAVVEIAVGAEKISFAVQDTGHFQNFVRRSVGTVRVPAAGEIAIAVRPRDKPGAAVMDLREIVLRPVPAK